MTTQLKKHRVMPRMPSYAPAPTADRGCGDIPSDGRDGIDPVSTSYDTDHQQLLVVSCGIGTVPLLLMQTPTSLDDPRRCSIALSQCRFN